MQCLIDSVFRKYPIPPIFLHEISTKGLGGRETTRFEIVDGQQRIRALADYHSDHFPTLIPTDKRLRIPNSLRSLPISWGKCRFSELQEEQRSEFLKRELDSFVLVQVMNPDEVRDLFIRLQSGTALTRQQIRDAWPGAIGPFVVRLAGKLKRAPSVPLFRQIDRRGSKVEDEHDPYDSDRQFCAQLLALFLARESDPLSQQSVGANDLDKLYHDYTTFDVEGNASKRFQEILTLASLVFNNASIKSLGTERTRLKFRKLDVIATFCLIQDLSRNPLVKFDKSLPHKLLAYVLADKDAAIPGRSTSGPKIAQYYEKWRAPIIEEIGIRLDPKRLFDEDEKRTIYSRDKGLCGICSEHVGPEDAEYDHYPTAHALGGKTVVENGRLVHAGCHERGRLPDGNGVN